MNPRFRSIFISDIHLGSKRSQAERLVSFLESNETECLYIVGDLVDAWGPNGSLGWPPAHERVLASLHSKADRGTRVVVLGGNHDQRLADVWLERKTQVSWASELEHRAADGRRFLVVHGDRFDGTLHRWRWLSRLGDIAARALERACRWVLCFLPAAGSAALSRSAKRRLKRWLGYTGRFERSAARGARERSFDGVICGHVHEPASIQIDGIHYLNGGDWLESCTAVVEHADGRFELLRWKSDRAA